jgi:hypothetical protein
MRCEVGLLSSYCLLSCRTGSLRARRSLRDGYTPSGGAFIGREDLSLAA